MSRYILWHHWRQRLCNRSALPPPLAAHHRVFSAAAAAACQAEEKRQLCPATRRPGASAATAAAWLWRQRAGAKASGFGHSLFRYKLAFHRIGVEGREMQRDISCGKQYQKYHVRPRRNARGTAPQENAYRIYWQATNIRELIKYLHAGSHFRTAKTTLPKLKAAASYAAYWLTSIRGL